MRSKAERWKKSNLKQVKELMKVFDERTRRKLDRIKDMLDGIQDDVPEVDYSIQDLICYIVQDGMYIHSLYREYLTCWGLLQDDKASTEEEQ